jgi:outer membrane lipoprotein-sorting protein
MKKIILILSLTLIIAFLTGCNSSEGTLEDTLKQMKTLGESMENLTAEVVQTADQSGEVTSSSYTLWYSNGRYRMEWDEDGDRQVEVYDGTSAWSYVEGENTVYFIRDLEQEDMFAFLLDFQERFNVSYKESTKVDGRETHVLEGTLSTVSGANTSTWWVDKESGLPFKGETSTEDWTINWEYQDFQINTELDESLFNFLPPAGSNIIHLPNNPGSGLTN